MAERLSARLGGGGSERPGSGFRSGLPAGAVGALASRIATQVPRNDVRCPLALIGPAALQRPGPRPTRRYPS
jgi:hypothetical protein